MTKEQKAQAKYDALIKNLKSGKYCPILGDDGYYKMLSPQKDKNGDYRESWLSDNMDECKQTTDSLLGTPKTKLLEFLETAEIYDGTHKTEELKPFYFEYENTFELGDKVEIDGVKHIVHGLGNNKIMAGDVTASFTSFIAIPDYEEDEIQHAINILEKAGKIKDGKIINL